MHAANPAFSEGTPAAAAETDHTLDLVPENSPAAAGDIQAAASGAARFRGDILIVDDRPLRLPFGQAPDGKAGVHGCDRRQRQRGCAVVRTATGCRPVRATRYEHARHGWRRNPAPTENHSPESPRDHRLELQRSGGPIPSTGPERDGGDRQALCPSRVGAENRGGVGGSLEKRARLR